MQSLVKHNTIKTKLILNTDDAVVHKSACESAYPVWVAIADLPPVLRSKLENFVLCSLWYGNSDCPWDDTFGFYKE